MTSSVTSVERWTAEALRASVRGCVADCRALDASSFVGMDAARIRAELLPRVMEVAAQALAVCRRALELYDPSPGYEIEIAADTADGATLARGPGVEIADVAFMGATELRPMLVAVEAAGDARSEEQLDLAGRVLRRVVKSLAALDEALDAVCGPSDSSLHDGEALARSIATRKHYARLRRAISGYEAPTDVDAMRRGLERVRIHLTMLVHSEVYAQLRLHDRRRIDELCARIDVALAQPQTEVLAESLRLWQDLVGFARLVVEVNRRQELVEHDAAVIARAHAALADANEIPPRLRARLEVLVGLDEELDRLLAAGDWGAEPWRRRLADLHEQIARPLSARLRMPTNEERTDSNPT